MSKHIIITGTGRSGTTFLVQLLTELKFDTGFKDKNHGYNDKAKAGMEYVLKNEKTPYIVKNPRFCDTLEKDIKNGFKIEHVIIPIRDLKAAVNSRVKKQGNEKGHVSGGLFDTDNPKLQEQILTFKFYNLMFYIVKYDLKHTFIMFPKLLKEPEYLYNKMLFLLKDISYNDYLKTFNYVLNKDLISNI